MSVAKGDRVAVSVSYAASFDFLDAEQREWLNGVGTVEVVPGPGDDWEGFPSVRWSDGKVRRIVSDSALVVQHADVTVLEDAVFAQHQANAAKQALIDAVPLWSVGNSGPGWRPPHVR